VSGPPETTLRLSLGVATGELQGLFGTLPEPDTVNLAGLFFSRRPAGRSRRGLPLFEEDSYRRWARVAWGGTARLYPFGAEWADQRHALWVEISVDREFAAGETRPNEEVTLEDPAVAFNARAVVPPRRVTVRLSLVRGDTASSPRALDLVPEAPGRRVSFTLGAERAEFDVTLLRPEPPRTGRDSALATDADVVCLRLVVPGSADPAHVRCRRSVRRTRSWAGSTRQSPSSGCAVWTGTRSRCTPCSTARRSRRGRRCSSLRDRTMPLPTWRPSISGCWPAAPKSARTRGRS